MKKPKTIADLKIIWTFIEGEGSIAICESLAYNLFQELNPKIYTLTIKSDNYKLRFRNQYMDVGSYNSESLAEYMVYMNYVVWNNFKESIVLDQFEQVSPQVFILHEKNPQVFL